ncbi:MAG TPA: hypothetical protein VJA28_02390 [Patescibacteria group bacterium]|nr:hypothetical protein [Patescibacteria group bacterium]
MSQLTDCVKGYGLGPDNGKGERRLIVSAVRLPSSFCLPEIITDSPFIRSSFESEITFDKVVESVRSTARESPSLQLLKYQ